MHYSAGDLGGIGGKCIIVQFLGFENSTGRLAPAVRRSKASRHPPGWRFGGDWQRETPGLTQRPGLQGLTVSPLLAHTCMPDRGKSFISIHIVNDPGGWGVRCFFKNADKCLRCGHLGRRDGVMLSCRMCIQRRDTVSRSIGNRERQKTPGSGNPRYTVNGGEPIGRSAFPGRTKAPASRRGGRFTERKKRRAT
jgi:hypothetical protein